MFVSRNVLVAKIHLPLKKGKRREKSIFRKRIKKTILTRYSPSSYMLIYSISTKYNARRSFNRESLWSWRSAQVSCAHLDDEISIQGFFFYTHSTRREFTILSAGCPPSSRGLFQRCAMDLYINSCDARAPIETNE